MYFSISANIIDHQLLRPSQVMNSLPPTFLQGWHNEEEVGKMSYQQLGKTDMIVSSVGLGGCVVGGVYPDKGDLDEIFNVR